MTIKNIRINDTLYTFVCDYRNTRNGFAHDCTLFIHNIEQTRASCFYINRTWEWYTYQTVMLSTIDNLLTERSEQLKNTFKNEHGYKKLTAKRKSEFDELLKSDQVYMDLFAVRDNLLHHVH